MESVADTKGGTSVGLAGVVVLVVLAAACAVGAAANSSTALGVSLSVLFFAAAGALIALKMGRWEARTILVALGVVAVFGATVGIVSRLNKERAREAAAAAETHRVADLRTNTPALISTARAITAQAHAALDRSDYLAAQGLAIQARTPLASLLTLHPVPPGARIVDDDASAVQRLGAAFANASASVAEATSLASTNDADVLRYDSRMADVASRLGATEPVVRVRLGPAIDTALEAISRRRARIHRQVERAEAVEAREAATEARAAAAAEQLMRACGPAPRLAADGTPYAAYRWARAAANDPGSVEFAGCTTPELISRRECWVVRCNFRARNGFGALVLEQHRFSIAGDEVLSVR